jgi:sugar O-acyltransferase (sialic acid O-acetyltransferase NeuD family)
MKIGIIGAGGFGREVYWSLTKEDRKRAFFFVDDKYWNFSDAIPLSKFDPSEYEVVVAVGNPEQRKQIVKRLPEGTRFFTHIHESVVILDPNIVIGEGSIICAGTTITTNVKIGKHAHLNLHSTVGHDTEIGDFFTTAPGVKISGNCRIGECVYFGTNSSVKEKMKICDSVVIGMNAAVVKDIQVPGTYVGIPAKRIGE